MEENEDLTKKLRKDSFYKQQQQRLQNITLNKDLSADDLIKNILEKVDTDAKISKFYNTQHNNTQKALNVKPEPQFSTNLYSPLTIPQCFQNVNSELPEIYVKIWNIVAEDNDQLSNFCDRDKLYQILISSNLSNDILAKLWSFVNRTRPGDLTKNELFVMLALIALVQKNITNPLNEIYTISTIPIPYFAQNSLLQNNCNSTSTKEENIDNNNTISINNDADNEFCEFKSADTFNENIVNIENNQCEDKNAIVEDVFQSSHENDKFKNDDFNSAVHNNDADIISSDILSSFSNITEIEANNVDLVNSTDKYNLFDACDLANDNNEDGDEEFGGFHSLSIIDQELSTNTTAVVNSENECLIKQRILTSIKQVMHKTFNILTVNHGEESVLEALNSENGNNFANDLYEVYLIADRIKSSLLNNTEMVQYNEILDGIFNNWNTINNLFKKASVNIFTTNNEIDEPLLLASEWNKCAICSADIVQRSNIHFHSTCANFWLHYVDPILPNI